MAANTPLKTIRRRYVLHEQLGTGGMGVVYRATDRLTRDAVALKRVTTPAAHLSFDSRIEDTDPSLALAQEFRTLASLHHPHIISVLDYGFDEQHCPYFTMSLLENAQTIVKAGQGCDLETQVDLLVQILQALAYLHRRGVLHRDLKPGNVLVANGQVKVLDFGLSVLTSQTMEHITQTTAGTIAYMAPELFGGAPITQAADLYAVGVMAYEVFAGRFPYNDANIALLCTDILTKAVDVRSIGVSDDLAAVLERLLVKSQEKRYTDAGEVIRDLCAATGCDVPPETVEIRESFLQAAKFVGRELELSQLSEALDVALAGKGGAWLIGGESGVGKSRLVDELCTLALVRGATVLRGQAVSEGGSPYHLWREALRWLVLTTDLEEGEASVLKVLMPDINDLLGREVPDALPLDPQAAQSRLFRVVTQILCRQCRSGPVVVILEDLQWVGSGSLALLERLTFIVGKLPLLILGNYRDDERHDLPRELPGMQVLKLGRLTEVGIAELSESMVGAVGREQRVVDLLQRETEGNPFFLVEVVRALAEEAGRLGDIGRMALPERVFAGGVQEVIQRRLKRVPPTARPLLQLAAVAGRELNLDVLQALAPEADLNRWLTRCADVAVLELAGEQWRFAHDKLRDGTLDALPDDARPRLHRQVAAAIEALYPGGDEHVVALAHHWEQAGETQRAITYLQRAGEQAAARFANVDAVDHFSRALGLMPKEGSVEQTIERYALLLAREKVYDLLGKRELQQQDLAALEELTETLGDDCRQAEVAVRQATFAQLTGDYSMAAMASRAAIDLARAARDVGCEAVGYLQWGRALWRQGDYEAARTQLEQALVVAQSMHLRQLEADSLRNLGIVSDEQGDYAGARACHEQALRIFREMDSQQGEGVTLNSLGVLSDHRGDYAGARAYFEQALRIYREIGDRRNEGITISNLGAICNNLGDYAGAGTYLQQALYISREVADRTGELGTLVNLGLVYHHLGDDQAGREYSQQAVLIAQDLGECHDQAYALTFLGHALTELGQLIEATDAYRQALDLRRELDQPTLATEPLAGLARVSLAQGHLAQAQDQVQEILSHLENQTLDGTEEPFRVYLTCCRVLRTNGDLRAGDILDTAHHLLQERAAKIGDPDLRRSFLQNVASHREIAEEFRSVKQGTGAWQPS